MANGIGKASVALVFLCAMPMALAEIYRWVDDRGVTHFSTTPPPETSQWERQVYDRHGRMQEQVDAPPTEGERERERETLEEERLEAEQRAMEQQRQRAKAAALQARMRQLDLAYGDLDDILEQRDRRLDQISAALEMSEGFVTTLEGERDRIASQMKHHTGNDATLERYRAELADLDRRLERERAHQERQRAMMAEVEARAARDLADYERLVLPLREGR